MNMFTITKKRIIKFLLLLFCLQGNFPCSNSNRLRLARHSDCNQQVLRIDNGGLLKSHREYGYLPYPNNLDCDYLIKAPPKLIIAVQFNFLNIEKDNLCNFDFVEFETMEGRKTKICGTDDSERFISNANQLFVRFHSDKSTNYEGFELRYFFVSQQDVKAGLLPWTKTGRSCLGSEFKCDFGDSCYQKEWICDGIRDCRDNSDEMSCPRVKCHQSQLLCKNGVQCLQAELWCNNRQDCSDNSDELDCEYKFNSTNAIEEEKPTPATQCSKTFATPKNLNLTDNPQIINGVAAEPHSWPWMASLRYGTFHFCGAMLLTRNWAVTAAHCVDVDPRVDVWRLDVGRHYVDGPINQTLSVQQIIKHPKYNHWSLTHDIALIKINEEIHLTTRVQPVCLPKSNSEPKSGKKCVILGWGYTQSSGSASILQQATVPVMDHAKCVSSYKGLIDNSMICAGYEQGGVDSCQGDSGGPLLCLEDDDLGQGISSNLFKLFGIISWGEGCALPMKPGVYSNVALLKQWIESIIYNTSSVTSIPPTVQISSSQAPVTKSTTEATQTTKQNISTKGDKETTPETGSTKENVQTTPITPQILTSALEEVTSSLNILSSTQSNVENTLELSSLMKSSTTDNPLGFSTTINDRISRFNSISIENTPSITNILNTDTTQAEVATTENSETTTESSNSVTTLAEGKTTENSENTTVSSNPATTQAEDTTTENSETTTESSNPATTQAEGKTTENSETTTESSNPATTQAEDTTTENSETTTVSSNLATTQAEDTTTENSENTTQSSNPASTQAEEAPSTFANNRFVSPTGTINKVTT